MNNLNKSHAASRVVPVAEPRILQNVYSKDQLNRMTDVVRKYGPWQMIIAQHFDSPEELAATMTGHSDDTALSYDSYLTATFRGYFAKNSACLYPEEIEDCFLNPEFLKQVRSYWNARYARPESMLFNINGACDNLDPCHLDAVSYRGINMKNSPVWLMNTMGKSGLFNDWLMKKAQVITWNYPGSIGGGFTYWPDGITEQPKRIPSPMDNIGVVVQNEQMYHRGEACGPVDQRKPEGLAFESLLEADPDNDSGWQITTGGKVIQRIPAEEVRFLVHWSAEIYSDLEELTKVMDHSDDLTHDKVFNMFVDDLKNMGLQFEVPTDPMHDVEFISLLTRTYDSGAPTYYPAEAPGPFSNAA